MTDPKTYLHRLKENRRILKSREAKYAGNAPLELLNHIGDHDTALDLTEQHLRGELSEAAWRAQLAPLLIALDPAQAAEQIIELVGQALRQQSDELGLALSRTVLAEVSQTPTGHLIASEFEQDPETYHKPLVKALTAALESNHHLAADLRALLGQQAQRGEATPYQASLSGTGSIAQGPGSSAATATGGGLAIGGNVGGDMRVEK